MTAKAISSPFTVTSLSATVPRGLSMLPVRTPPSFFNVRVLSILTPSFVVYVIFHAPATSAC